MTIDSLKLKGVLIRTFAICVASTLWAVGSSYASVIYEQNFDGLTAGGITGQDSYTGTGQITAAPDRSGQALYLVDGTTASRAGIFPGGSSVNPQFVSFDFRLTHDIFDYLGTPNINLQHTIGFRGPAINQEFFFVYSEITDASGNKWSGRNGFEIRATPTTAVQLPGTIEIRKDIWYHVQIDLDYSSNTIDAALYNEAGSLIHDYPVINGFYDNGNSDLVNMVANGGEVGPGFYLDNFRSGAVPEPSSAILFLFGGAALLWFRRSFARS